MRIPKGYVPLEHSTPSMKQPNPKETINATAIVRPRVAEGEILDRIHAMQNSLPAQREYLDVAGYERFCGAAERDIQAVEEFGREHGLSVVHSSQKRRSVQLRGTLAEFSRAFAIEFVAYEQSGVPYRSFRGPVSVPEKLAGTIEAVLGLDSRAVARTHLIGHRLREDRYLDTEEVARYYRFPQQANGKGECIGIIELGGGFHEADIAAYFERAGLVKPEIKVIEIDGQQNNPADPAAIRKFWRGLQHAGRPPGPITGDPQTDDHVAWTIEATMDVQLAGAFANAAKIVVYFAPGTWEGKYHALTKALTDRAHKPSIISCSWGAAETPNDEYATGIMNVMNRALYAAALTGVTVCCSSGDQGLGRVFFPGSSPYVLTCGGTAMRTGDRGIQEAVWRERVGGVRRASTGGFSAIFEAPPWQRDSGLPNPMKGVPDVAGKADIANGYRIVVGGTHITMGGTSAAAPMWAGLIARINEGLGKPAGFVTPLLYQERFRQATRDITKGMARIFRTEAGWDAATGWGSPDGEALLAALSGAEERAATA